MKKRFKFFIFAILVVFLGYEYTRVRFPTFNDIDLSEDY